MNEEVLCERHHGLLCCMRAAPHDHPPAAGMPTGVSNRARVRAQANMGNYDASARFYVRALGLNPGAAAVWGYLRTSLACMGRMDLMDAVHESDLDALSRELPL